MEFADLTAQFPEYEGTRSIVLVEVSRISDSCGYGVPCFNTKASAASFPPGPTSWDPKG